MCFAFNWFCQRFCFKRRATQNSTKCLRIKWTYEHRKADNVEIFAFHFNSIFPPSMECGDKSHKWKWVFAGRTNAPAQKQQQQQNDNSISNSLKIIPFMFVKIEFRQRRAHSNTHKKWEEKCYRFSAIFNFLIRRFFFSLFDPSAKLFSAISCVCDLLARQTKLTTIH